MFTVIMTGLGILVFIISLITSGFSKAFRRLLAFAVTGLILDLCTFGIVGIALHNFF